LRYAILSDIHANLDAFEAVIESLRDDSVDRYLCLGDIVGYGARPRECLDLIQSISYRTVAGNHDFAALGKIEIDSFNTYARQATIWTRESLSESDRAYLESLPLVEHLEGFSIVHGTLYSPELFDYVQTSYDAYLSMCEMPGEVCFFGHSHVPITFIRQRFITYSLAGEIDVERGTSVLVNVGSVGQPRDNNPQAAYALFDTDRRKTWSRRVH